MKKIVAFLNHSDRRSRKMEAYLTGTRLPFESIDVSTNPEAYAQMVKLSGQTLTPCVVVEGTTLDTTDEQVLQKQLGVNRIKEKAKPPLPQDEEKRTEQIQQRTQRKGTLKFF